MSDINERAYKACADLDKRGRCGCRDRGAAPCDAMLSVVQMGDFARLDPAEWARRDMEYMRDMARHEG